MPSPPGLRTSAHLRKLRKLRARRAHHPRAWSLAAASPASHACASSNRQPRSARTTTDAALCLSLIGSKPWSRSVSASTSRAHAPANATATACHVPASEVLPRAPSAPPRAMRSNSVGLHSRRYRKAASAGSGSTPPAPPGAWRTSKYGLKRPRRTTSLRLRVPSRLFCQDASCAAAFTTALERSSARSCGCLLTRPPPPLAGRGSSTNPYLRSSSPFGSSPNELTNSSPFAISRVASICSTPRAASWLRRTFAAPLTWLSMSHTGTMLSCLSPSENEYEATTPVAHEKRSYSSSRSAGKPKLAPCFAANGTQKVSKPSPTRDGNWPPAPGATAPRRPRIVDVPSSSLRSSAGHSCGI
mmetsp:Transcript_3516/g.14255  ORF Transcript_3516/g.14255 Transcript_3516/m.14255 type:complete len:358 (+) Transcript_3516:204-1277(+)